MTMIVERWQYALIVLVPAVLIVWLAAFGGQLDVPQSFFLLHLAVYMIHQVEEHLWPGGFRQFTNAHVFESGQDNFPVNKSGVALVNIGYVWLPLAAAAVAPQTLYWVGVAWFGLSFANSLSHIGTSIRFRMYNPGVVTSVCGLLPFSVTFFATQYSAGLLSGGDIALAIVSGVLLHVPVAALFVVPYREAKTRLATN